MGAAKGWGRRLIGNRATALVAALILVSVPTFFGTFPEATEWSLLTRVVIMFMWALLAGVAVVASVKQGEQVAELVEPALKRRQELREAAGTRAIQAVLTDRESPLASIDFRLFVYDKDKRLLLPIFEETDQLGESEGWEIGKGATGRCYETGQYVPVAGPEIADGSYGLSPNQQIKYASLSVVAAMPVKNARGDTIAVLTGSSEAAEAPTLLQSENGEQEHYLMAQTCARLLIDVLQEAAD